MVDTDYSAVPGRLSRDLVPAGDAGVVFDGGRDFSDLDDAGSDAGTERSFRVVRPVYTQRQFDDKHGGRLVRRPLLSRFSDSLQGISCDRLRVAATLRHLLPCIGIMQNYSIRDWLLLDCIAGLTVGIMHIPQGMAYAFLAELPPYMGLYTSFFPPLLYFFFGTSRQISMGTLAIISLLVGGLINKNFPTSSNADFLNVTTDANLSNSGEFQWSSDPLVANRVALACAVCACVGAIQLFMGVFRLGFLTRYLSDPLISGFTMGVAVHVFSSQIKYVLGIQTPSRSGAFSLPLHYFDLVTRLHEINGVTFAIAAVSVVILYVTKEFVNPRVKKKIKAPLPVELLIVILGTAVSYAFNLNKEFDVKVVGPIPAGIPRPEVPSFSILRSSMLAEIVTIAIIAFSVCVSLAKIFGKKYNYDVAPSQELIAYGICNFVGSFFHCWPAGSSLSRSAVQDSMGGKTQLAALFSSSLLLLVLLFVGKYFETVPNCCLSAIILVAIRGMLEQIKEAPILWRLSPYDFWTWTVTCAGVVLLSVDYGLLLGLVFSILCIVVRTQSPTSSILGRIPETDLYKNVEAYDDTEKVDGVTIFRYEGSLYFACAENFRESLIQKTGVNPRKIMQRRRKTVEKYARLQARNGRETVERVKAKFEKLAQSEKLEALRSCGLNWKTVPVHHIILDASTWGYMDYVGLRALDQTILEFKQIGVAVYLANPKCGIRACLQRSDFYEKHKEDIIYVSVHDAVLAALYDHKTLLKNSSRLLANAVTQPQGPPAAGETQITFDTDVLVEPENEAAKAGTKV